MDIHTIIFSKDRPAQLDLLIRSVKRYYPEFTPTVMVFSSTEAYYNGYEQLSAKLNIELWGQAEFELDVKKLLKTQKSYTQFLVDDQICIEYEPYDHFRLISDFLYQPEAVAWSVRLGQNSWKADGGLVNQGNLLECLIEEAFHGPMALNYLRWSWTDVDIHFPYCYYSTPMSVDGNIFKTDFLVDLVEDLHFNGPNQLEGAMEQEIRRRRTGGLKEVLMGSAPSPAFVNSPNNRVQNEVLNGFGQVHPMTAEEMNQKYLEGYQLSLDFELPEVFAPHHEIELEWEKYDSV